MTDPTTSHETFTEWVILELMGHRRLAGLLTEQEIAGRGFLRLDIPSDPPTTQLYNPQSVYCITPTSRELATQVAARNSPAPVQRWELPALEPSTEEEPAW
jgi:hypothetical protein